MENNKLLSIGETARILGVSIQTLRRWDNKGILKSFRVTTNGKRFYKENDIKIFTKDLTTLAWGWASDPISFEPAKEFYCAFSDSFTARLRTLQNDLEKVSDLPIHYALLTSMVGEIGDNSYAHNVGNWPDLIGTFFAYDLNKRVIVLADRGRGILETLKNVRPELTSHQMALKVAFTEIISGRFPERRGNGLKSVVQNILSSDVKLIFRTGNAQLDLQKGDTELRLSECETFHGCFATLKF